MISFSLLLFCNAIVTHRKIGCYARHHFSEQFKCNFTTLRVNSALRIRLQQTGKSKQVVLKLIHKFCVTIVLKFLNTCGLKRRYFITINCVKTIAFFLLVIEKRRVAPGIIQKDKWSILHKHLYLFLFYFTI